MNQWAERQVSLARQLLASTDGDETDNVEFAIDCCRRALHACDRGSDRLLWAETQHCLGRGLLKRTFGDRTDDVEEALVAFTEAIEVLSPHTEPVNWSALHHVMGLAYQDRIRGDRAENIEKSIVHLEKALGSLNPKKSLRNWMLTEQALGSAYDIRIAGDASANVDEAIRYFEAAERKSSRRADPEMWAMVQTNLGTAYARKHGLRFPAPDWFARAEIAMRRALEVRTRERDPRQWARTSEALAAIYVNYADRVAGSLEAEDADLRILLTDSPGRTPVGVISVSDVFRLARENIDKAVEILRATSAVHDHTPGDRARHRALLARALGAQGALTGVDHWLERAALLDEALRLHTRIGAFADIRDVAAELGEALATLGRWTAAGEAFQRSIAVTEMMYPAESTSLGRQWCFQGTDTTARWASYCLAKAGRLAEATLTLERARARVLGDSLDHDGRRLERLRHTLPQLYRRYCDARKRLLRMQDTQATTDAGGEQLLEVTSRLRIARGSFERVVQRIRRVPGYEDFLAVPGWATIEAAVSVDAPLAYLDTTPWGTLTLLVIRDRNGQVDVRAVWADDFTQSDLDGLFLRSTDPDPDHPYHGGYIRLLYGVIETKFANGDRALSFGSVRSLLGVSGAEERDARDELRQLAVLGQRVVSGLVRAIADLSPPRLVVVPTGMTNTLPIHTIPCADGRSLIDMMTVSFAPSARVLCHARQRASDLWPAPSLSGVANTQPTSRPLWYADRELDRIADHFETANRLRGRAATKPAVLNALGTATHVHFACHGATPFDGAEPYLALAGDDRMTLADIAQRRPFASARLVALSACQSALVGPYGAQDDPTSLLTAVMLSGVPGVLGTLWPVDDLSTALLMERFYALHLGEGRMPPSRALCEAQKWLAALTIRELREIVGSVPASLGAAEAHDRPFADPYYWAPFVFIGE